MSREGSDKNAVNRQSYFLSVLSWDAAVIFHVAVLLLVILAGDLCVAAEIVNPTDIEPEAPQMLNPHSVYVACGENRFDLALEEPKDIKSAKITSIPVADDTGRKSVSCMLKGRAIQVDVSISGTGEGMCGAVNGIKATVSVDSKKILDSDFANYCTPWGVSGLRIESYYSKELVDIVVCGYWPVDEKIAGDRIESKTYNCASYRAKDLLKRDYIIRRGARYLTPDS